MLIYVCSTYIGIEYECLEDTIIPSMNRNIEDGSVSFIAHMGDMVGEFMFTWIYVFLFSTSIILILSIFFSHV